MGSRHCWSSKSDHPVSSLSFLRGPQFFLAKIDLKVDGFVDRRGNHATFWSLLNKRLYPRLGTIQKIRLGEQIAIQALYRVRVSDTIQFQGGPAGFSLYPYWSKIHQCLAEIWPKMDPRCFVVYLSQILMDFASIWVILKAESCWATLILYCIGNKTRTRYRTKSGGSFGSSPYTLRYVLTLLRIASWLYTN